MADAKILMSLRMPPLLYKRLTLASRSAGVSMNALIVQATADMLDELEETSGHGAGT